MSQWHEGRAAQGVEELSDNCHVSTARVVYVFVGVRKPPLEPEQSASHG